MSDIVERLRRTQMPIERTAEAKAFALWLELSYLLGAYRQLEKQTNSEPLFDNPIVERIETALYENRPFADWEPQPWPPASTRKPKPLNRRSLKFRQWLEKNCREIVRRKRLVKY